jgi:hypothetical protein
MNVFFNKLKICLVPGVKSNSKRTNSYDCPGKLSYSTIIVITGALYYAVFQTMDMLCDLDQEMATA